MSVTLVNLKQCSILAVSVSVLLCAAKICIWDAEMIDYLPTSLKESLNIARKGGSSNNPVDRCDQMDRISLLHHTCQSQTGNIYKLSMKKQNLVFHNIFVDEKHKILACLPPKSGCTTWKTILANNTYETALNSNIEIHLNLGSKFDILRLSSYNSTRRDYLLNSMEYFKFMVARHPFERVYSAYMSKLVSGTDREMQKKLGGKILNLFHPELPEKERRNGSGVTFKDFIQFIK